MEIRINLGAVGTDLGTIIEAKLSERQLPECLGNMIPPILSKLLDVDSTEIFEKTESLKDEEKAEANMKELVVASSADISDMSLTKAGLEKLENTKIHLSTVYAERLNKCVSCPLTDVCNKLTQNYLKIVELESKKKLEEVNK